MVHAVLGVLLAQALHRDFERAPGSLVGHQRGPLDAGTVCTVPL
jgi:hypothetical protein